MKKRGSTFGLLAIIALSSCQRIHQTDLALQRVPASRDQEASDSYESVAATSWRVAKDVVIEARLLRLLKDCVSTPCQKPYARLIVKNLKTGQVIYDHDSTDTPERVSVYDSQTLVVFWGGGSAERIEILSVTEKEAQRVLYESFRFDASLVKIGDDTNVLITTSEGGGMPLYTTRYVWKENQYRPAGKIPFNDFNKVIGSLFEAPSR